jgi:RNA polymerase sigma factor, sigma-70 family
VLQETWIVAIRKLEQFRGESSFKTWITAILINKCHEKAREKTKHDGVSLESQSSSKLSVELVDTMDIKLAMKNLAPGYRKILVLHDVEGYKHEEIASLLGISVGTSKSQLFHARQIVRDFLTEKTR